ncbi:hypothetical protein SLA2020_108820 [Shorea laevis]
MASYGESKETFYLSSMSRKRNRAAMFDASKLTKLVDGEQRGVNKDFPFLKKEKYDSVCHGRHSSCHQH